MSIPDYQSLMLPVLVASAKGEVRIGPVVDELANQLGLSPEERRELLPSGRQPVFTKPGALGEVLLEQGAIGGDNEAGILLDYGSRTESA
jgi:restriction endonuclease Mrr